jgi:hypothetical protein
LLYKVPGIGKIIASVIAASVPDPSVFKSGRDFTAWLVGADNPVRFIDAFVAGLDLAAMGFVRVTPRATGRPGYAPGDLLKLPPPRRGLRRRQDLLEG